MRITAQEKEATRQRILDAALDLFRKQGFDVTTTRDIAQAAGIATGTLFNYFATKEAIVGSLAEEALGKARQDFSRRAVSGSLEEQMFALIAAELRQLKPLRKFLAPALETSLNPLVATNGRGGDDGRIEHLEAVTDVARRQGVPELSPVALQLYSTLYTGVLTYWTNDKSPKQEDTLALLDQSLAMFAAWLQSHTT
jgi:AcrR family transcriptional regulator